MNRFMALTAAVLIAASCSKVYDDASFQDRLDKVEASITDVEKALEAYMSQIASYKVFADAYGAGSHVTKVDTIRNAGVIEGYSIWFGDAVDPVVVMNGQDGEPGRSGEDGYSPVLGIELGTDNRYYWTVDGQIKEDMPASPTIDGLGIVNGETPEIFIRDGKWYMKTPSKGEVYLGEVSDSNALVSDDVFGDVELEGGFLLITFKDDTVIRFPVRQDYGVSVDEEPVRTLVYGYEIAGAFDSPVLSVLCPAGWSAEVDDDNITFVPEDEVEAGEYVFNVIVTDGTHSASAVFTLNYEGGNQ